MNMDGSKIGLVVSNMWMTFNPRNGTMIPTDKGLNPSTGRFLGGFVHQIAWDIDCPKFECKRSKTLTVKKPTEPQ